MAQAVWETTSDTELVSERDGLRLVVSRAGPDRSVRFQVLRTCPAGEGTVGGLGRRPTLVQSGHRGSVQEAMLAAERAAARYAEAHAAGISGTAAVVEGEAVDPIPDVPLAAEVVGRIAREAETLVTGMSNRHRAATR